MLGYTGWTILTPFFLTVLSLPLIKLFAFKTGAVDYPDVRRMNKKIMPRLGGLAFFLSFSLVFYKTIEMNKVTIGILLASLIIIITGIFDDILSIKARTKLKLQIISTLVLLLFLREEISMVFFGNIFPTILLFVISFFWVIGIINSINLIDGLDGLAGGVIFIALGAILFISISVNDDFLISYTLILMSSIFGFLLFNFYPAKIYMGDTGSLFLGLIISIPFILILKYLTFSTIIIPILILIVPISDTIFSIIRRFRNGVPIFKPDKRHLHHRLVGLGIGHRNTVLVLYIISFIGSSFSILLFLSHSDMTLYVSLVFLILYILLANDLGLLGSKRRFYPYLWNLVIMLLRIKQTDAIKDETMRS